MRMNTPSLHDKNAGRPPAERTVTWACEPADGGWRRLRGLGLLAVFALGASCGGGGAAPAAAPAPAVETAPVDLMAAYPPTPAGTAPGASATARTAAAALAQGVNFGNMLDAPNEGDWGLKADDEFINLVGQPGGFTRTVRLPVRWSNHASADAAASIDPVFMARVQSVVDKLLTRGVTVMLNMHHYRQLDGDGLDPGEKAVAAEVVRPRFLAMWQQIAKQFAAHDKQRLIFELYNEPHGALEPAWNDLASRALRVVRASNPERVVVIGPVQWNSASALAKLSLPADANLVLTVHHYEPFNFTHQGAEWITPILPAGQDCCDAGQLATIRAPLDLAVSESKRLGYPVFVGEFGAYSKAPAAARVRYLKAMRAATQDLGLPWIYWELAAGFGLYDPATHAFRADVLGALYGPP